MSITNNVKARLRIASKTEAEWASSNPVGLDGEWMVTSDASPIKIKIGDGTNVWSDLEYAEFAGSGGDYLPLSGGTMTGALNVIEPTADSEAANKAYVDDAITTAINNITVADDIGY